MSTLPRWSRTELMAQTRTSGRTPPGLIGNVAVGHEGGAYTLDFYFTSERGGTRRRRKEPPPQLKAQMKEMNQLNIGEPEFLDLNQPWLYAP